MQPGVYHDAAIFAKAVATHAHRASLLYHEPAPMASWTWSYTGRLRHVGNAQVMATCHTGCRDYAHAVIHIAFCHHDIRRDGFADMFPSPHSVARRDKARLAAYARIFRRLHVLAQARSRSRCSLALLGRNYRATPRSQGNNAGKKCASAEKH